MVRLSESVRSDSGVDGALRYVRQVAESLEGVEVTTHAGIGLTWSYQLGDDELGHVHGDGVLHVRLSRAARDLVVGSALARALPHDTERRWVEFHMHTDEDAYVAVALLERSHRAAQRRVSHPLQERELVGV